MKEIRFRPLRRVKKSGKIVVASYQQWNAIRAADCSSFILCVDPEYRCFDYGSFVYNHLGEQLFFWTHKPSDIVLLQSSSNMDYAAMCDQYPNHCLSYGGYHDSYYCQGLDVEGTPYFAHLTMDYMVEHKRFKESEPLTVGVVLEWYQWFLGNLKNVKFKL